jgi:hypothetical protein
VYTIWPGGLKGKYLPFGCDRFVKFVLAGLQMSRSNPRDVPDGWTQTVSPGGRAVWQCPEKGTGLNGVELRCIVTYPRHRVTSHHKHQLRPVETASGVSIRSKMKPSAAVNRSLACLAGNLNISARAATSPAMNRFIVSVIEHTFQYAVQHPSQHYEACQIFTPMSDKVFADELTNAANELTDSYLAGLKSCAVTLMMDAGTIFHHHFLNYVVSFPGLTPFLVRSEYRDRIDQFDYEDITRNVVMELANKDVVVGAIVADNLFPQQSGLRLLVTGSSDPDMRRMIICPCANHTLNLVLQCEIKNNPVLKEHIAIIKRFQHIMRQKSAVRQYGLMCPDYPETRWLYICGALRWIDNQKDDLIPGLMQCIADMNEIGKALKADLEGTGFDEGSIPEWILRLHAIVNVLEKANNAFESRNCTLPNIVPIVEQAKSDLLKKADGEQIEWLQQLSRNLAARLIARFRKTFNQYAAITAYLLSAKGRNEYSAKYLGGIPIRRREISDTLGHSSVSDLMPNRSHERMDMVDRLTDKQPKSRGVPGKAWKECLDSDGIEIAMETWDGFLVHSEESNTAVTEGQEDMNLSLGDEIDVNQYDLCDGEGMTYQAEFTRLRDNPEAMIDPVFGSMMAKASNFLVQFAEEFDVPDDFNTAAYFHRWMTKDISWRVFETDPPEAMWVYAGSVPQWEMFSILARRIVAIIPSESEVERTISIQRGIASMRGTQFGQRVFTARTQLHTISEDVA